MIKERWTIDIDRATDTYRFKRYVGDDEAPNEIYTPVDGKTAAVWAVSVIEGFDPPRQLRERPEGPYD